MGERPAVCMLTRSPRHHMGAAFVRLCAEQRITSASLARLTACLHDSALTRWSGAETDPGRDASLQGTSAWASIKHAYATAALRPLRPTNSAD